ncbi:hypothetical protein HMPREF1554_00115 [Porphyromonas gingivalis F0569]|nr:hypothetical protein HMPREF1554_00115 [Porphyromonas gingivalis F0569]ERJ83388.1 hypothetical protein HMPREF1988_01183 [Porphyromonas gingivalis F0185]ERJ85582.1 hypothetical protein HMPREF1989_01608 [Porphyromonas gingivalis F0566]
MVVEGDCLSSFKRGISAPLTQHDVHKSMFIAYLRPLKKEEVSYIYYL